MEKGGGRWRRSPRKTPAGVQGRTPLTSLHLRKNTGHTDALLCLSPRVTQWKPSAGGLWQPLGRENGREDLEMFHGTQERDTRYLLLMLNLPLWGMDEARPHRAERPRVPKGSRSFCPPSNLVS